MTRPWQGIVGRLFKPGEFGTYVDSLSFHDWKPEAIVIHNTQVPTLAEWQQHSGRTWMENLAHYYRDDQGWSSGPHLFVEPAGIWIFTPLSVRGVHSPSWNATTWGLEIVGDYDVEAFTEEMKNNVLSALLILHRAMGWTEPRLRLHREDPATSHKGCPGKNIDKNELEMKVQFLLALGLTL